MWLRALLLANTEGLRPCSVLPFGLIGYTIAAEPVLCTAAPFLHIFLHLLAITIEMPMDVVQVLADGSFLSSLPFHQQQTDQSEGDKTDQPHDLILKLFWL